MALNLALLLHRLRRSRGAVALEAVISVLLMLGAFYTMWGAALVIFNQSKVLTATQFASQGALIVYDRSTYRGGYPEPGSGGDGGALAKSQAAADSLLQENGTQGMAPDQFSADIPTVVRSDFRVRCGPSIAWSGLAATEANCRTTPIDAPTRSAAVTRVDVGAYATGSYWLLSPLSNASRAREGGERRGGTLRANSVALSASKEASP